MILGISGYIGSGKDEVAKMVQFLSIVSPSKRDFGVYQSGVWTVRSTNNWEIKKFAAKLKQVVSLFTGISIEDLEKQSVKDSYLGSEWNWYYYRRKDLEGKPEWPVPFDIIDLDSFKRRFSHLGADDMYEKRMKVRELLQLMGTNALRNQIHPNIHVNALFSDFIPYAVDTDVHFPNWIISDLRFPNEFEAIHDRQGINIKVVRPEEHFSLVDGDAVLVITNSQVVKHISETALDNHEFDWVIYNDEGLPELLAKVQKFLKEYNLL